MKKKTLSLFLVLIMCLSLMPAGVFAQDAVQEQTPEQTETVIDPEQQEIPSGGGTENALSGDEEEAQVSKEVDLQSTDDEESTPVPTEDEAYQGITFRYGNGNSLNVTLPEDRSHYTYGTSSDDGTVIKVIEENVTELPKTGWNWVVCKVDNSGGTGTTSDLYNSNIGLGYGLRLRDFHIVNTGSGAVIESQVTLYIDLWGDSEVTATDENSAAILVKDGARMRITSIMDNGLGYSVTRAPFDRDDEVGIGTLIAKGGAYGIQSTFADDKAYYNNIAVGGSAKVTATGAKAGIKAEGVVYARGIVNATGTGEDSYGISAGYIQLDNYKTSSASGIPLELTSEGKAAAFDVSERFWYFTNKAYTGKVGSSAADAATWEGTDAENLKNYKYAQFIGNGVATVSNISELRSAIKTSPQILRIYVKPGNDYAITSTLYVEHQITFIGVGSEKPVLTRGSGFTGSLIQIGESTATDEMHGHVRMKNLVIDGKNIKADAPAIYLERGQTSTEKTKGFGRLLLSDVEIRNCVNKGCTLNAEGDKYEVTCMNKAGIGGAIMVMSSGVLTMYPGCKITNCTAYYGGAVYLRDNAEFYGVTISDNTSADLSKDKANSIVKGVESGDGGGIYCVTSSWGTGSAFIYDCTISNNTATRYGGALSGGGNFKVYDGSVIEGNKATQGGGIFVNAYKGISIQDSTIENNEATKLYGGGICAKSEAIISNSNILKNKAAQFGGGLYLYSGGTITECTVNDNEALTGGGAYIAYDNTIKFINCKISNNKASQNGGGIYSYGVCNVNGGTVNGNTATNNGGGVYNYLYGTNTLTDVHVYENNANNGGGIFAEGNLTLENTKIYKNTATVNGGGLCGGYTISDSASQITKDTEIYSNKAANGGGVYLRHGGKTWIMSGIVKVRGNTIDDGATPNDLFVQAKGIEGYHSVSTTLITIGRNETIKTVGLAGLSDDSYIGLTMEKYPEIGEQTTVAKCGLAADNVEGDTPDYSKYFHTEDTKYTCSTNVTVADDGTVTREVVLGRQIVAVDKPEGI